MQHEHNREKMDSQDRFFKASTKQIHEKRYTKEENFEMFQQQERAKVVEQQKKNTNPSGKDELLKRAEKVSSFIEFHEKELEFVEEREKLIDEQEKKMEEMKKRHFEQMLDLEREFDKSLEQLMNKHNLHYADD